MGNLSENIKNLPENSGVYIMYDKTGTIIYIGKARNLKNRVRQYFSSSQKPEKVAVMVSKVDNFRYIITNSEIDALILEATLIKLNKPQYNILLKDDRSYPYIRIDTSQHFPSIEVVRKLKKDGAKYFGPFMSGININNLLDIITDAYPVRNCSLNLEKPSKRRACLNYHIQKCSAPCLNKISHEEYAELLKDVMRFLNGEYKHAEQIITHKMTACSDNMDFENALVYRNKLDIIQKLRLKRTAAMPRSINLDIFAYTTNGLYSAVSAIFIRNGIITGQQNYPIVDATINESDALSGFLTQFYSVNIDVQPEIALNICLDDTEVLQEWFAKNLNKTKLTCPKKGAKYDLVKMAETNAIDFLEKSQDAIRRKQEQTYGATEQLQQYLNLPALPTRIECYDISNTGGSDSVASMVVFINGEATNAMYRRFKIQTVEGADDFKSLNEALTRRLTRLKNNDSDQSFGAKPDLILIDGGKGQLSSSYQVVEELKLDIPIISLAKQHEEVFLPQNSFPLDIPLNSLAKKLLIRIRDESHRFAITSHRKMRAKRSLSSTLSKIKGIGKKKQALLLKHFKGIAAIKVASEEELLVLKGISKTNAKDIFEYFRTKEQNEQN